MRQTTVITAAFIYFMFNSLACSRNEYKGVIPCENYGTLYDLIFRNKVVYLPDSLGGDSLNGRIAVKVFFDSSKNSKQFAIVSIRLFKKDTLVYNFYEYYKVPINKLNYSKQVVKYYDFVNDYLINKVYFRKNKLPLYCDKNISITYLLPIGNK